MSFNRPVVLPRSSSSRSRWREFLTGKATDRLTNPIHAAALLRARGETELAVEALYDVLSREPYHVDGLNQVVSILASLGRDADVRPLRSRLHEIRCRELGLAGSELEASIAFLDAAFGAATLPKRAPLAFIRATFDRYADFYDIRLRRHLGYRSPELLGEALSATSGLHDHGLDVLDIGCGTGLAASVVRPMARRLEGIDASPRMLERARERDSYDLLHEGDLVEWLEANKRRWDVIMAADVVCHFGNLGPLMQLVAGRLASMGRFVFTVDRGEAPVELNLNERFAHSERHLRAVAEAVGLDVVHLVERVLWSQNGKPVSGYVAILRRRGSRATT